MPQPSFTVRIVIIDNTGSMHVREYVRGNMRMGCDRFAAFALGDMLLITGLDAVAWQVYEVTPTALGVTLITTGGEWEKFLMADEVCEDCGTSHNDYDNHANTFQEG